MGLLLLFCIFFGIIYLVITYDNFVYRRENRDERGGGSSDERLDEEYKE